MLIITFITLNDQILYSFEQKRTPKQAKKDIETAIKNIHQIRRKSLVRVAKEYDWKRLARVYDHELEKIILTAKSFLKELTINDKVTLIQAKETIQKLSPFKESWPLIKDLI